MTGQTPAGSRSGHEIAMPTVELAQLDQSAPERDQRSTSPAPHASCL
jgi:hypothetical protein